MFCSLVSFDFLFVFQETIRVRILFQSFRQQHCVQNIEKKSVWISPSKAGFYRIVHLRHTLSFEEMLHIYLKFHGCNDAWIVGSYVLRTLCIFYIKSPKVSGAELELVAWIAICMCRTEATKGDKGMKNTLYLSQRNHVWLCLYINMPLCLLWNNCDNFTFFSLVYFQQSRPRKMRLYCKSNQDRFSNASCTSQKRHARHGNQIIQ